MDPFQKLDFGIVTPPSSSRIGLSIARVLSEGISRQSALPIASGSSLTPPFQILVTNQNRIVRFARLGWIKWAAFLGVCAIIAEISPLQSAQASYAIPYQTVLRKDAPGGGKVPVQGTVYFKFVIYRVNQPEGGGASELVPVWSHDPAYIIGLDSGRTEPVPEPARLVSLQAVDGIASLLLGGLEPSLLESSGLPATTPPGGGGVPVRMPALDANLFADAEIRLRIWFGESSESFEILGPDLTLAASPFALRAAVADGVAPGSVVTGSLAPEVADILSAAQTLQALTDRMVLISDVSTDPILIGEGFVPIRTLDPAPWDQVGQGGGRLPVESMHPPHGRATACWFGGERCHGMVHCFRGVRDTNPRMILGALYLRSVDLRDGKVPSRYGLAHLGSSGVDLVRAACWQMVACTIL